MRYRFDGSTVTVEDEGVLLATTPAKDQAEASALIKKAQAEGPESIVVKPKKGK